VRAANTGISGIVDPRGGIIAQTDIFERTALKGNIKFINLRTIYAQYGDILVYICFAIMIICILLVIIRRITDAGRKYSGNG
jgi:apolipoprotein N-acyltransferase